MELADKEFLSKFMKNNPHDKYLKYLEDYTWRLPTFIKLKPYVEKQIFNYSSEFDEERKETLDLFRCATDKLIKTREELITLLWHLFPLQIAFELTGTTLNLINPEINVSSQAERNMRLIKIEVIRIEGLNKDIEDIRNVINEKLDKRHKNYLKSIK